MPDRPLVTIAAPSFMWTVIQFEACKEDLGPDCEPLSDASLNRWHEVFGTGMSGTVYRAGFRREVIDAINPIMQADRCRNHTTPIVPADHATFLNPNFEVAANMVTDRASTSCDTQHKEQPAVVAELTNLALSLWALQKSSLYSPWSIKPFLSPNQLQICRPTCSTRTILSGVRSWE
jgi:hypothetical protein